MLSRRRLVCRFPCTSLSVPCLVSVVVLLFSVQLSLRALKSCTIDSRYLYFFSQSVEPAQIDNIRKSCHNLRTISNRNGNVRSLEVFDLIWRSFCQMNGFFDLSFQKLRTGRTKCGGGHRLEKERISFSPD